MQDRGGGGNGAADAWKRRIQEEWKERKQGKNRKIGKIRLLQVFDLFKHLKEAILLNTFRNNFSFTN